MKRLRLGLLLLAAASASGASPEISSIAPAGVQRGAEVEFELRGEHLADLRGLLFYHPGITVNEVTALEEKKARVRVAVAADCALGEHPFRAWTSTGVADLKTVAVGPFPTLPEQEPNNDAAHAQPVAVNSTIEGVVKNEDLDVFSLTAKKGDRISVEVEAMRLGGAMLDAWVAICDHEDRVLAECDDTALYRQDPAVSIPAPYDGSYLIKIRESAFGGEDRAIYRLHIGNFPRPLAVYPAGGRPGETVSARLLEASGEQDSMVTLPDAPETLFAFHAGSEDAPAPGANLLRISALPNVFEREPNDGPGQATAAPTPGPVAFNGRIEHAGDEDWFRFTAGKDEEFDLRVWARDLRSPLDSVLQVGKAGGEKLADNDDRDGPDSGLHFKAPADGDYTIRIRDQIGRGGADFAYRIEVSHPVPSLVLSIPPVTDRSQERQAIAIPRGNRVAAVIRVKREGFEGAVALAIQNLPPGVTMTAGAIEKGDSIPVVFEAAEDAPIGAALCEVTGSHEKIRGGFSQPVDLVIANPNNSVYYQTEVSKLAVAVVEPVPFKIRLIESRGSLPQSGSRNVKVSAERFGDFQGPISLQLLSKPAGIGAGESVTLPADETKIFVPLNANADAPKRISQIVVLGSADLGRGISWVTTEPMTLEVKAPWMTGEFPFSKVERGQSVAVKCKLKPVTKFEGTVRLRLMGLPNDVTAPEVEVAADATEAVFQIAAGSQAKLGPNRGIFCQLSLAIDGDEVAQTLATNGVLRIDEPKKVAVQP